MTQSIQQVERTEGVVVACRRSDGRWLLIRRSALVRRPLRVCFPGGWIETGESQAEAVARECVRNCTLMSSCTLCLAAPVW
jgi:8-oxo-dGTP pyrophosphatase MutT (NUDIX family)